MRRSILPLLLLSIIGCSLQHSSSTSNETPETDGGIDGDGSNQSKVADKSIVDGGSTINDAGVDANVDAGIKCAPNCQVGDTCNVHSDCASNACNYKRVCVSERSCVAYEGGYSCGQGEVGDPNAQHESCCLTDTLPSGVKIERYKITAGRMRQMIERENGNILGWYETNKNKLNPATVAQLEAYKQYLPTEMRGDQYSVVAQLSAGVIYIADKPSNEQGCSMSSGAGTHTYWFPPSDNALYGDPPNGFPQSVMDTKPVNCIAYPLAAAFCAWDGGRMQTIDENQEAYGLKLATHAWDHAGGFSWIYDDAGQYWGVVGPVYGGFKALACPGCDTTVINWSHTYEYPLRNPNVPFDYSYYISPPGRFPRDKGPYGTMDVAGDMLELTSTTTNYLDDHQRSTMYWGAAGSWEMHGTMKSDGITPGENFLVRYGKTSSRCVRY